MARMLEVPRAERIYLAGDPSDEMFLLKAGVVKITTPARVVRKSFSRFSTPVTFFGELAIVDDSPRDHVATVHEDAVLCAFNREQLLRMVQQSPVLGYQITKLMGYRLRRFRTRVRSSSTRACPRASRTRSPTSRAIMGCVTMPGS